jgi:glutamate/tyrosine decarboxylase-like PLP-dependent enzyme
MNPSDPTSQAPTAPATEDAVDFMRSLIDEGLTSLSSWKANWPDSAPDPVLDVPIDRARSVVAELTRRLEDNYPFFHPDYAGQMLKPPHAIATIAYFLAQQINPNNHALDGGPATAAMEHEVVADLARLFGYETHLGHLTSSGTIANLEALWVARQLRPGKAIAFSREAHYTHERMCQVIDVRAVIVESDANGRMDLDDLQSKLRSEDIGTVVVTTGTTAFGAIDPVHDVIALRCEHDFRVHVDAAYGGFFRLLAEEQDLMCASDREAFLAIAQSDSVVVDPHKHGLQPYGCGSVIFRDPSVGHLYKHDSPYTYFTSKELHLGEISLECSRAGAAAAALWATLRCFPLQVEGGLGAILRKSREAALAWSQLIRESSELQLIVEPSLDIVTFFPWSTDGRVTSVSRLSEGIFETTMNSRREPVYLAKLNVKPPLGASIPELDWDAGMMVALRSVLMKPEHLERVPSIHDRVLTALRKIQ